MNDVSDVYFEFYKENGVIDGFDGCVINGYRCKMNDE